jgi:hypothetical protein
MYFYVLLCIFIYFYRVGVGVGVGVGVMNASAWFGALPHFPMSSFSLFPHSHISFPINPKTLKPKTLKP